MLTVLSGGTGTPKLLQGLARLVGMGKISVIVNTAEDVEVSGLKVTPDLDTVMYTLAGIVNEETWYGIRGDTFTCHEMLKQLGEPELLRIGDRDRAVKLRRTLGLKQGKPLSEVTQELCEQLGVRASVLPMSDDRVQTRVDTEAGTMQFHEFWVRRRAADKVKDVSFEGVEEAKPAPGVLEAIKTAKAIIIGPSNPVTSIGPILAIEDIREEIIRNRERVVAVSPIVGSAAVSGPAGELMRGLGYRVNPLGVAKMYRGIIGTLVLDWSDRGRARAVEEFGINAAFADLLMPNIASRVRLAREVLGIARIR
ncbi:MAG: 2-phospho-L-lactate transferase [Hadesarchaea archaeon]|nr:2-phospho-L-lactate transferase [Hadesarchaea archaeon]MDH5685550.1 2-phospho-L-lactate transferase [Hadesarchaea archaeon]